jgi:hypothetical protein
MQPIILKLENKNHFSDYGDGFTPDVDASEFASDMRELGDIDEILLSAALNHIFGRTSAKKSDVAMEPTMVGSSSDRLPVRKTMYLDSRFQTMMR